jgi:hypothetical protein
MQDWIKSNGLQIAIMAAGAILAWGAINARVSAIEAKVNEYPSQDWFELKFDNIDKQIIELDKKCETHIETGVSKK